MYSKCVRPSLFRVHLDSLVHVHSYLMQEGNKTLLKSIVQHFTFRIKPMAKKIMAKNATVKIESVPQNN